MNPASLLLPGDRTLVLAAGTIAQVTVVILAAAVLAVFFRRNAAVRHGVWLCALVGVLISPGLAWVVPATALTVATLPNHLFTTRSAPGATRPLAIEPAGWSNTVAGRPLGSSPQGEIGSSWSEVAGQIRTRAESSAPAPGISAAEAASLAGPSASRPGRWRLAAGLALWAWVLGGLVLLARLIRGHRLTRRLRQFAHPIDENAWEDLLAHVAATLRLARRQLPPIAALATLGEPVTMGVTRPVVLLPDQLLRTLAVRQLHDVLVHECAHVVRRDPLVGMLQRLAELLFWPYPLVHVMNRRLSRAREEVCDNHVLRAGDPIGYARTLLAVAEACPTRRTSAGLATYLMTPRWSLEARVAGLLDPRRIPMTTTSAHVPAAAAALFLVTGLAIAGVRLEPGLTAESGPQENRPAAAPQARPRRRPEQTRIIGLVVDEPGRPVAGAVVRVIGVKTVAAATTTSGPDGIFTLSVDSPALHHHLLHASSDRGTRQGLFPFPDTLAQPEATAKIVLKSAKSLTVRVIDGKGAAVPDASLDVPTETVSSFPLLSARTDAQGIAHLRIPADAAVPNVIAFKPGVGFDYYEGFRTVRPLRHGELEPLPETITLVLDGARTARLRALDSAGAPIPDVELAPWDIVVRGRIAGARPSNAPGLRVKTDAQGVALFDYLPAHFQRALFSVHSETVCLASIPLGISADEIERELTIRLLRTVPVAGRVIGADGRPAAGILLQVDGRPVQGSSFFTSGQNARTGMDGTFRFLLRPEMSYMIVVIDERWAAPSKSGILTREGQPVEGIELRLIPGTVVRGRATVGIGPDSRPAADQVVALLGPAVNAASAPGKPSRNDFRDSLIRHARTEADGTYQFRVGPGEYMVSLPPGIRESGTFRVSTEPEIVRDFAIEKPPLLQLAGLVVPKAPGGRPVAGAIVEGRAYGTNSARSRFRAVSDTQGQFSTERYRDAMILEARSPDDTMAGFSFITADDEHARIPIAPAAAIRGRITDPDGKPSAGTNVYCRIVVDPPGKDELKGLPLPRSRFVQTDADGRFTFEGIPVSTRCTLLGRLKIGETWHPASVEVAVTQPGPISAPDLVLPPRK